jgi:hypothetical protein
MSVNNDIQRDLLESVEQLWKKYFSETGAEELKNCLSGSMALIAVQEENRFDRDFFEALEEQTTREILRCSAAENLAAEKRAEIEEQLAVIFRALDYTYAQEELPEAMPEDSIFEDEAESIEPWWDDEDNA